METYPKLGMKYEQARSRLLKYKSVTSNANLANSLLNQVKLHEGESAATELAHEFNRTRIDTNNHSGNRLGSSPVYAAKYNQIKWS